MKPQSHTWRRAGTAAGARGHVGGPRGSRASAEQLWGEGPPLQGHGATGLTNGGPFQEEPWVTWPPSPLLRRCESVRRQGRFGHCSVVFLEVLFQREQRPGGESPADLRVLGCAPGLGNPGFHPAVDAPLHGDI